MPEPCLPCNREMNSFITILALGFRKISENHYVFLSEQKRHCRYVFDIADIISFSKRYHIDMKTIPCRFQKRYQIDM